MENENNRVNIGDAINQFKSESKPKISPTSTGLNNQINQEILSKETDPDLLTSFEVVKLPSNGMYYDNNLSEVNVEYMTSKDEDVLTTPSLLEKGTVLDVLLKRKIKTAGVDANQLLTGDRNAIILFLRTSSYGSDYNVEVTDPRDGSVFKDKINLLNLKYKEINEKPNENGEFTVNLPMRKKIVKVRLLTYGEDKMIEKKAETIKEAYGEEVSPYNTMKLKASIVSIDGNTDRSYIDRFVDAMPALDAYSIRRKLLDVSPDIDMNYEFTTKDGYKFESMLSLGLDFFFPSI